MSVHAEIIIRRDQIATLGNDLTSKDYLWGNKIESKIQNDSSRYDGEKRNERSDFLDG